MSSTSTNIQLPLTDSVISSLHIGQHVRFFGTIYTARDAAHKRLISQSEAGEELPVNLAGQVIYYVVPGVVPTHVQGCHLIQKRPGN